MKADAGGKAVLNRLWFAEKTGLICELEMHFIGI